MSTIRVMSVFVAALVISGCSGTKVTRVAANSTIDLSGKWNDADSRMVSEEMLKDCLDKPWYQQWAAKSKIPTVVVGEMRNMSHEHINMETFIKDLERVLVNSGKVEFVANAQERQALRDEVASQKDNATSETKKQSGQEIGADLMLTGSINSIVDQEGDEAVMFYQIDLELIEIQSHRKIWIGDKKIKKFVERDAVKL
ncbi:MAG: penicillin-binding protein activator LpoB [Fibrobacteria bacterium]|nr:penicillin-binding protein activator LpoB [Fibrobacteria bacterium]